MTKSRTNFLIIITYFFLVLTCGNTHAQQPALEGIQWLRFDTIASIREQHPKPILIFIYKKDDDSSSLMINNTLGQPEIRDYINTAFYPILIEASQKDSLKFLNNQTYYKSKGTKYHELVTFLLGAKPTFPALVYYTRDGKGYDYQGFKDKYEMLCSLVYFNEEVQKTENYESWRKVYFETFPPGKKMNEIPLPVHWMSLEEAMEKNVAVPKGIFLFWYTKWNASSTVLLNASLRDSAVVDYLNENYYNVRIDAQTSDTLRWKDIIFVNDNNPGHFHQMVVSMLKGKLRFPSLLLFDKDDKLIWMEQIYLPPQKLLLLAKYVKTEAYRDMAFRKYLELELAGKQK